MKIRILLCSLTLALAVGPVLRAEEKEPQTELGSKMEKISGAYRKLKNQVADASKNDDSLAQVAIIKENATAALKLKPAKMANVPAADQDKFVADYQAEMKKLLDTVGQLEADLKAGKNEDAAKVYATLAPLQKEAHTAFKQGAKK